MIATVIGQSVGPIDIWELLIGLNVALTALLKWRQKQNHGNEQEQYGALLKRITDLEGKDGQRT